jgi:hypothetical protein
VTIFASGDINVGTISSTGMRTGATDVLIQNVNPDVGAGLTFDYKGNLMTGVIAPGTPGTGNVNITYADVSAGSNANGGGGIFIIDTAGNINLGDVDAWADNNEGGTLDFTSGGDLTIGYLDTSSFNGNGGAIILPSPPAR